MWAVVTLALLLALLGWLFAPSGRRGRPTEVEPVDEGELAAAEREVRDLGTQQRPEEGFAGDDWGPGAPKTP